MNDFNFVLQISGQCPSGKNAVIVTRAGHRFPSARFVEWRQAAMNELFPQLKQLEVKLPITNPVDIEIEYTPKDRIRRDAPGIIDALWHLIEKVGVISDDTYLAGHGCQLTFLNTGVDKKNPGVKIVIRGNYASSLPLYKKQSRVRIKRKPRRLDARKTRRVRKKTMDTSNS